MKDTSPQVYPIRLTPNYTQNGMTLLQYYAGQAMQTMCNDDVRYDQYALLAKDAFRVAESMMEEYNKRYRGVE